MEATADARREGKPPSPLSVCYVPEGITAVKSYQYHQRRKRNCHLMTIETPVENSFLLSYIFLVLLGSLIPVQGFVEWLLFLLPDQSPIIKNLKKKVSHYLSSCIVLNQFKP